MSNLPNYYHFKLDFQKVDQHTGGKWLFHGTKCHKGDQLQSLELPCSIQYSRRMSRGRNIQGVVHLQNQTYLCKESLLTV